MRNKTIAVLIITVLMFTAFAFLVPFERNTSFWIAYCAELLAIALQIPIFKTAFEGKDDLKSKVLGFPIARVGYIYLGVQTALSLLILPLGFVPIPVWLTLLLCILVFGAALVCSISAHAARVEIEKIEAAVKPDTDLMSSLKTRSSQLINKTNDAELKKKLSSLADNIRFSDPVSSSAIAVDEQKLADAFSQLENAVLSGNDNISELCDYVQNALDDRNTACKNNKAR